VLSLGADPSSTSAGLVLAKDGKLAIKDVWKPARKATRSEQLLDYYDFTLARVALWRPEVAVVLQMMNMRGAKVVRAISYFEAATLLALARHQVPTYRIGDGTARAAVLDIKITASKEDVVVAAKERFDIKWSTIRHDSQGKLEGPGLDEIDAFVAALSWSEASKQR
jgi:hypothetical protein